jgi:hypothetical protein
MENRWMALLIALGVLMHFARYPALAQELGPHFKKIKDGIYVYAQKPADSNAAIILAQDGVILIDSGHNPPDSYAVLKAVKQLTPLPVRFLINTE